MSTKSMFGEKRRPYVYDPDSPLITEDQLSEWKPVNFATMEERAEAMKAAGIRSTETVEAPALAARE